MKIRYGMVHLSLYHLYSALTPLYHLYPASLHVGPAHPNYWQVDKRLKTLMASCKPKADQASLIDLLLKEIQEACILLTSISVSLCIPP